MDVYSGRSGPPQPNQINNFETPCRSAEQICTETCSGLDRYRLRSAHIAGGSTSSRDVAFQGVIHDHAVCIEPPSEGANGPFHTADPAAWQAILIALIVEGNDFIAERVVQVFAIAVVMDVDVGMGSARANGEAVVAIIGFGPPAIENGKVEAAIEDDFLSAGAGGFHGAAGVIEPHIDALNKVTADVNVVILDEDEPVGENGIVHQLGDLLQDFLSRFVVGVGFAGKDELHRA